MHLRHVVAISVLACCSATALEADQRAWFLSGNSLNEVAITAGGRDWTPRESIILPPHQPISPILWGGGRYILWFASRPEGYWFVRFDTRSRQVAAFPVDFVPWAMAVDRLTARLVVLASSAVYLVDVNRLVVVEKAAMPAAMPPPASRESRSLAVARGHIFVGRTSAEYSITEVVVLDAGSLALVRTIPGMWYVQASRDETRVYLQRRPIREGPPSIEVQIWEPAGLTMIGTTLVNGYGWVHAVGDAIVSESRIAAPVSPGISVCAYDHDSLNVMGCANVSLAGIASSDIVLELRQASRRSPVVLRWHTNTSWVTNRRVIHVFDAATLARVRVLPDAPFDPAVSNLLMLAPPDPLPTFNVVVNGRTALLTWAALPDIGEYEVVVGTAPGLSDVGTFRTAGVPQALFHDVPAGTFYVRVRAMNELGSVESAERPIYVPQ